MSFTQLIELEDIDDDAAVRAHIAGWDEQEAEDAPGYLETRLFQDLDSTGRYLVAVEFSSQPEALRNNERAETGRWAQGLQELATTRYVNLKEVYRTAD